mgnify:CR=1 FL=1
MSRPLTLPSIKAALLKDLAFFRGVIDRLDVEHRERLARFRLSVPRSQLVEVDRTERARAQGGFDALRCLGLSLGLPHEELTGLVEGEITQED